MHAAEHTRGDHAAREFTLLYFVELRRTAPRFDVYRLGDFAKFRSCWYTRGRLSNPVFDKRTKECDLDYSVSLDRSQPGASS